MSWEQALSRWEGLDDEDPQKWEIVAQLMQNVGMQQLQGQQIAQNRTDGEIEMRGSFHGFPARMKIDMSFGDAEWELKAPNPSGRSLFLFFDEDAIPNVGGFSGANAAWDDDNEVKIFFARGFYMETGGDEIDAAAAVYQALAPDLRNTIAQIVTQDRIAKIYAYSYGDIWLNWEHGIHEMRDPVNLLSRGVWLMGQLGWTLSQLQPGSIPPPDAQSQPGMIQRVQCRYCGTLFIMAAYPQCPNCGAPFQG